MPCLGVPNCRGSALSEAWGCVAGIPSWCLQHKSEWGNKGLLKRCLWDIKLARMQLLTSTILRDLRVTQSTEIPKCIAYNVSLNGRALWRAASTKLTATGCLPSSLPNSGQLRFINLRDFLSFWRFESDRKRSNIEVVYQCYDKKKMILPTSNYVTTSSNLYLPNIASKIAYILTQSLIAFVLLKSTNITLILILLPLFEFTMQGFHLLAKSELRSED